ncbi:hypothetical protein S40285_06838 [Stachybotrys chlorohalonatus IBT 40285]|uniref:Major facilitator superfamily (MFS) profile domain-containing protein n=1 Tax=Stachybotrys chlorohalonatus (strain IBT 40285) TaxID=1283841 RepID=A0A084QGB3_STAC4|nr:hypothetical protein S40285_06838 [Stachybotrys chlorohalonata IBT 40285]
MAQSIVEDQRSPRISEDRTEAGSPISSPIEPSRNDTGNEKSEKDGKLETTVDEVLTGSDTTPSSENVVVEYPSGPKLAFIIMCLCTGIFLVALDQTIIAPALGTITTEYGSVSDIGWYGSAYLLTTTALQPTYGKLYRLFNVKWIYLTAVFIFEIGSLVCGVAPTSTSFIIGRAVAGMGTAGLFSGSIVILSLSMPLEKRPLAFGFIGGMWGIASVAGPLLGGAFTETIGWRWCFYINLPVGGLAMIGIFFFVNVNRINPDSMGLTIMERVKQLDWAGTVVFLPAVMCLLLALEWGGAEQAWDTPEVIGLCVAFGVLIIIFIGTQIWRGDSGTLPPRLFKHRNILPAMIFSIFFAAGFFPFIYFLSLYFQAVQGVSAVQAGIRILPMLLSNTLVAIFTGVMVTRFGYFNPIAIPCMILFAVGAGMVSTFDVDTGISEWFGYQVLAGLGIGAGFQVGVLTVQTNLPTDWIPIGTSCIQFFQAMGGAIFVSVCQTLFQNGLIESVTNANIDLDPHVLINGGAAGIPQMLESIGRSDAVEVVLEAYMDGLRNTFYVTTACACCAFLACITIQWRSVKNPVSAFETKSSTAAV